MNSEWPFRLTLSVVLVLVISIVAYHRIRAAASGERISRREEGYFFAVTLRLAGLALWLATFSYLFFPKQSHWLQSELPGGVRWAGGVLGLMSAVLMYWTLTSLGRNLTDTVVTRERATLVTHGPYRWVRHPFYVTAALMMTGVSLLAASWGIALASAVVLAMLAVRTRKEEAMLVQRFGDAYRDYMAKTGRFFPKISAPRSR